jgi:hypothetical protein
VLEGQSQVFHNGGSALVRPGLPKLVHPSPGCDQLQARVVRMTRPAGKFALAF